MKIKLKKIFSIIASGIAGFFSALFFVFYFEKKESEKIDLDLLQRTKEDEIQKTPSDILIARSRNAEQHARRVDEKQQSFRERVRDRFSTKDN